ncbi:MAG: hypothetical protein ACFFKA_02455 [Candidatus Thorarchaeota archaeon]
MRNKNNNPVIIGIAQRTQRKNVSKPLDPLSLMLQTSKCALEDTNVEAIETYIDSIYMVNIRSWSYEDAPGLLGKELKIQPKCKVYLPDGGNTPQMLVNRAARKILNDSNTVILITGGECGYSAYRRDKEFIEKNWPEKKAPKYMEGPLWNGINDFENSYRLYSPVYTYALFETAFRASINSPINDHLKKIGELFEKFSRVAAKNPFAWKKELYQAEDIVKVSKINRMISYPYNKLMCSNLYVDQSASLIITSDVFANQLEVSKDKWVYLMGSADFENVFEVLQRPNLYDSPAAREGAKFALTQAGLSLNQIDLFDIYSCFPSIVQIIRNELGIKEDDPRDLTITGGLPYFGGPWSNYSLHAIVTAVERIRNNHSLKIMIAANGGYNTKQSFGIYGRNSQKNLKSKNEEELIQKSILDKSLPPPIEQAKGYMTVKGYTIPFNREGGPFKGIVIGEFEDHRRTLALLDIDDNILHKLTNQEFVGKKVRVYYDNKTKYNKLIFSL